MRGVFCCEPFVLPGAERCPRCPLPCAGGKDARLCPGGSFPPAANAGNAPSFGRALNPGRKHLIPSSTASFISALPAPPGAWCLLSGPARREISALPLAPALCGRARSAPGRPRLMSHPLRTPRPASHTHGSTDRSILNPQRSERPAGKAARCPGPAVQQQHPPGCRLVLRRGAPAAAAARGQMAAGTRGARNAEKGEVGELKRPRD